jgi:4-amino-4-deoxy-L-arabinose transferase-like glycosyltransferase
MSRVIDHRWLILLLLTSWCGFLFFYGLNAAELYRTEGLRAIVAQEALRNGNWIVPTLYGQPLLTKPPGMYIAIALCSWPFGEVTQWTARLPSALAASIAVLLFYWYFARQLGRHGGLVAAAILPASALWLDKAPSAEIDILQVAWVAAAILLFLRGLEAVALSSGRLVTLSPLGWWLASLLCVAGGFLTKWTAPLFFYATVLPLLWWRGQLRMLVSWPHLVSAGLAALLCLGWAAWAAALVGWDTFWGAVSREALQHLSPEHRQETLRQLGANHHDGLHYGAGSLLFLVKMLGMTLPWSVVALWTWRRRFVTQCDERGRSLLSALHCWAWPNLLIWAVLPDPSPRHAAPLVPAFAGLAALVCTGWLRRELPWMGKREIAGEGHSLGWQVRDYGATSILLSVLLCWLVVKVIFVEVVVPARTAQRLPRFKAEKIAALVPAGEPLYLFQLKDEGIMFYYGREVRRLAGPEQLPSSAELAFCMVKELEYQNWTASRSAEPILRLDDQQGAPILLLKVTAANGGARNAD